MKESQRNKTQTQSLRKKVAKAFVVVGFWLCVLLVFFNAKNSESHTRVLFVRHTRALCEGRVARSTVDIAIQENDWLQLKKTVPKMKLAINPG